MKKAADAPNASAANKGATGANKPPPTALPRSQGMMKPAGKGRSSIALAGAPVRPVQRHRPAHSQDRPVGAHRKPRSGHSLTDGCDALESPTTATGGTRRALSAFAAPAAQIRCRARSTSFPQRCQVAGAAGLWGIDHQRPACDIRRQISARGFVKAKPMKHGPIAPNMFRIASGASVRSDRSRFRRNGSSSSTFVILSSGMRARLSAGHACGSTALSLAVPIRV